MSSFRHRYLRPLLPATILLISGLTACKKYERVTLELANRRQNNEQYNFRATEERKLQYTLRGSNPVDLADVRIQSAEPTITGSYEARDSAGFCIVTVTLRTAKTPGGAHPVRITFINRDDSFLERNATLNILNFAQLLRDSSMGYLVVDSISYRPFDLENNIQHDYSLKVRQLRTDPPNRFVFNALGLRWDRTIGYFYDVVVDIDSITGEMNAATQAGSANYRGSGWLHVPDQSNRVGAFYTYSYQQGQSSHYEGRLSF